MGQQVAATPGAGQGRNGAPGRHSSACLPFVPGVVMFSDPSNSELCRLTYWGVKLGPAPLVPLVHSSRHH